MADPGARQADRHHVQIQRPPRTGDRRPRPLYCDLPHLPGGVDQRCSSCRCHSRQREPQEGVKPHLLEDQGQRQGSRGKPDTRSRSARAPRYARACPRLGWRDGHHWRSGQGDAGRGEYPPRQEGRLRGLRILLADDHPVFRRGLKQIIEEASDLIVAGEAANGAEALRKARTGDYDVVLLDITMPVKNGVDVLSQLKHDRPALPVLMLSMHPEEQYAVRALRAGASGYLTKESAPEELVAAIP